MATQENPMTSIAVLSIRRRLEAIYPPREAGNITRIICCEMMGQSRTDYYLGKDINLSRDEEAKLQSILKRLLDFEPLQYLEGSARFCGHSFFVAPGVLIPRPETEELVELIQAEIQAQARVLDIGTGSGCIAISLALGLESAQVEAWDISPDALAIARHNSQVLRAGVQFRQRDVLTYQPTDADRFDVIVSNPPYITEREKGEMQRNVLDWEPHLALFVPDSDPLLFYRRIGQMGRQMLNPGGRLYFEINRAYGPQTVEMLQSQGYTDVRLLKDISGNDRMVTAAGEA